jgi:hypothetical protein
MLVVDRRDDLSAYAPGANRAEVQMDLEHHTDQFALEAAFVPARVAVEHPRNNNGHGVACVTDTPGPEVLLETLLKRVWGVSDNRCTSRYTN